MEKNYLLYADVEVSRNMINIDVIYNGSGSRRHFYKVNIYL